MNVPVYSLVMRLFIISLTVFIIFATSSFAEQPLVMTGNQLKQQAAWLGDLHDYEFKSKIKFGVSGMNLEFNINHKAMVPDYFVTEYSIPMMKKQFLSAGNQFAGRTRLIR